jgi:hypothetical protein
VRAGGEHQRFVPAQDADDLAADELLLLCVRKGERRLATAARAKIERQPKRGRSAAGEVVDCDDAGDEGVETLESFGGDDQPSSIRRSWAPSQTTSRPSSVRSSRPSSTVAKWFPASGPARLAKLVAP